MFIIFHRISPQKTYEEKDYQGTCIKALFFPNLIIYWSILILYIYVWHTFLSDHKTHFIIKVLPNDLFMVCISLSWFDTQKHVLRMRIVQSKARCWQKVNVAG
jgi:hypothetical protein